MSSGVIVALILAAGIVVACVTWRWAAWPCPSWLVPLLENPYFQTVAGADRLMERAGVKPGMQVLDAGCGPGRLTIPLARRVGATGRVVALDLQRRMLEKLRRRVEKEGLSGVELVRGGLGEGLLPDGVFDVAFLVTVLGEVPDKVGGLVEIRRSLRPGGVLTVTEVLPDPHYLSLGRVRRLGQQAGLVEERSFSGVVGFTLNLKRPV
jgi:ubiquinone/menaquinone biosynthesis C-methylase UbiE